MVILWIETRKVDFLAILKRAFQNCKKILMTCNLGLNIVLFYYLHNQLGGLGK